MKSANFIPSVNFHLWEPCNFRCKYCFATFQDVRKSILPKGHLPKEEALLLIDELAKAGFSKITFAGGEPTLCPWLAELIERAKQQGLVTMVVTNGTGLNSDFLSRVQKDLDWVVFSIDSIIPKVNKEIGRHQSIRIIPDENYYRAKVAMVRQHGIKLKVNTVISKKNLYDRCLPEFIMELKPDRWKLFQPLAIKGQNDLYFEEVCISGREFIDYMGQHSITVLPFAVVENNAAMTNSYIMVDPAGRFFDNSRGEHTYSQPLLKVGALVALKEISYDYDRFLARGGDYNF